MGIPYCYSYLIHKYPYLVKDNVGGCDRLFLDFNSIIHTISQMIINENKDKKCSFDDIELLVFKSIIDHTLYLTKVCPPKRLLFIAVDGIAPRAKQHQQRRRRYLSRYKMEKINDYKRENNINYIDFDTNAISPGTVFMEKLMIFVKNYFDNNSYDFSVLISDQNEIGEGEHKLIRYMKNNNIAVSTDIIYGLDADLIQLTLVCDNSIFLMRESSYYNKSSIGYNFHYLDINSLKGAISRHLNNSENKLFLFDYIFITMFVGNDFLPGLSFLKIKNGAIDILCYHYKKVYDSLKNNFICHSKDSNKYHINKLFLEKFLISLSLIESDMIINVTSSYYGNRFPEKKKNLNQLNDLDFFLQKLDDYPIFNKEPLHINPREDKLWRVHYYNELFGDSDHHIIKSSCFNFLESLVWTVNYYFNNSSNCNWYYKYNFSPTINDLIKYISIMTDKDFDNMHNMMFNTPEIVNDYINNVDIQLLLILPPQSHNLINKKLLPIITDIQLGCVHYYPINFKLNTYLKKHLWECIPLLPDINIDKIIKSYNTICLE